MNELTDQLRKLGEAAEASVSPVSADQVTQSSTTTDLDAPSVGQETTRPSRRTRWAIAAAAAFAVLVGVGSAVLVGRTDDPPAALQTASQTESSTQESVTGFAVPDNDNGWAGLRSCESSSQYDIDSGNTFYGAYQFTYGSFQDAIQATGMQQYEGVLPVAAPPEIQDAIANAIFLDQGDEAWPVCGRFIDGPMITPVVPQWIGQPGLSGYTLNVFLEPDIDVTRIDEIRDEIVAIVGPKIEETIDYVNQQQAFEEFQSMFEDQDEMLKSLTADVLPPRFQMIGQVNPRSQMPALRDIVGVFDVVTPESITILDPPPPMKISVPRLELQSPVYGAATVENLAKGPAVLGGNVYAPVVAGYGSVDGAVFDRLQDLKVGDLVVVTMLQVEPNNTADTEVRRTYQVDAVTNRAIEDLPGLGDFDPSGVTLVADMVNDPTRRIIVTKTPTAPNIESYGLQTGN